MAKTCHSFVAKTIVENEQWYPTLTDIEDKTQSRQIHSSQSSITANWFYSTENENENFRTSTCK